MRLRFGGSSEHHQGVTVGRLLIDEAMSRPRNKLFMFYIRLNVKMNADE
jgi:hypothetical protein